MNDQELRQRIVVLLYRASKECDNKSVVFAADEIMEIIKQDQAIREIDIRIDELKNTTDENTDNGDQMDIALEYVEYRIAELQSQKDKLMEVSK